MTMVTSLDASLVVAHAARLTARWTAVMGVLTAADHQRHPERRPAVTGHQPTHDAHDVISPEV